MRLFPDQITDFQRKVYDYFEAHGRDLPWRKTADPYHTLVSEIMLQQTQVDRVIPKYEAFIIQFPTFEHLAEASVAEVLTAWSGLGYNRRARYLKKAVQVVVEHYGGKLPTTLEELQMLPGIGSATAASISAFGFNLPTVFIETNVRSVFLFEFFPQLENVNDQKILPLVEQTLDRENPRKWYNALMDYGAHIKKLVGNPNKRSRHYAKQSTFAGSTRQLRGQIIRELLRGKESTVSALQKELQPNHEKWEEVLASLVKDNLISLSGGIIKIQD